jgi:hypothetical protein
MRAAVVVLACALVLSTAGCSLGRIAAGEAAGGTRREAAAPQQRASIPFVSLGGVRNWRAEDDTVLFIENAHGTWYRATFFGRCPGLRYEIELAFVTDGMNQLDRFSSVLVDGQRCWFRTFERIQPEEHDALPEPPE